MCYLEPIIDVVDDNDNKITYVKSMKKWPPKLQKSLADKSIDRTISGQDKEALSRQPVALRNCGNIDPEEIDSTWK